MNLLCITIAGNSGKDVYFERLKESLKGHGEVNVNLIFLPHLFQLIPFLIRPYLFFKRVNFGKYNIIHTNAEFGHFFKVKGKPLLVTILHSVFNKRYQKYTSIFQKIFHYFWIKPNLTKTLKLADKVVAISHYTKRQIVREFGIDSQKIKAIYCGIDPDKFKPEEIKRNNSKIRLLFVGNLTKRKGADLLPQIINRLGSKYILYYTTGRSKDMLKDKKHKNMFSLGKLMAKEMIKEYNMCDLLLFPTRLEGFGYVVAEAMACKKPVVATNCSSMPELVENEKGGFLCKTDDIDNFVAKIKILAADKSLRKKMGQFNRKRVLEKFTLERMAKEYLKLYQELIKEK